MNLTGMCPKCGSGEVVRFDGGTESYDTGFHIKTGIFGVVPVNQYICTTCGYTEQWVDMEDMPKIVKSKNARTKG